LADISYVAADGLGPARCPLTGNGKGESSMDSSMVRIVCTVLAVVLIGLIVMRRRKNAEE
jgi:hypothetical protein